MCALGWVVEVKKPWGKKDKKYPCYKGKTRSQSLMRVGVLALNF